MDDITFKKGWLLFVCFLVRRKPRTEFWNASQLSTQVEKEELQSKEEDQQGIIVVKSLSHVWLCNPMDWSTPGFPVLHHLLELAQPHVHWIGDAIQTSHPLSSPSPPFHLSQHQGLFQWVSSLHQVAKLLELQLWHQSSHIPEPHHLNTSSTIQ